MQTNDKNLVKKRFLKSLKIYNDKAFVQKQMAQKMLQMLFERFGKTFDNVFEIGCGAGLLTDLICKNIAYKSLWANDIVSESKTFVHNISDKIIFCEGDIETVNLPQNLDLIVSNATFQWMSEFEPLLDKLSNSLTENGVLCFSTFGEKNFKEISATTGVGLKYKNIYELKRLCCKYFEVMQSEEATMQLAFDRPIEVLKHIKSTGTNGLSTKVWTKRDFVEFEKKYPKTDDGYVLTYHPIYFLLKKL